MSGADKAYGETVVGSLATGVIMVVVVNML
jgi:hypothetical protein